MKVPFSDGRALSKIFIAKPELVQNIALNAPPTARNFTFPVHKT